MDFLGKARKDLDEIDDRLVELLEKRFKVVGSIVEWKKARGIPIENKSREEIVKARYLSADLPKGYSDKFFGNLFDGKKGRICRGINRWST